SNEADWARADYVVACKATLVSTDKYTKEPRYKRFKGISLLVIDEAHLSITDQFSDMVDWFTDRGASVLGVTATPMRTDKLAMGNVYREEVFNMGIIDAIDDGWLVGCKTRCIELASLDLSKVGTSGGDFKKSDLGRVME